MSNTITQDWLIRDTLRLFKPDKGTPSHTPDKERTCISSEEYNYVISGNYATEPNKITGLTCSVFHQKHEKTI